MTALSRLLLASLLITGLGGCVNQTVKSTSVPPLDRPATSVAESELLDVAVAVFDPGLDNYEEDQQSYPEVRKAEARFMPRLLTETLQNTGAWGAVRVIPGSHQVSDLLVEGTILYSDGENLRLHIRARDTRGTPWLDREYNAHASRYAYNNSVRGNYDAFQAIYHQIANDLLRQLETLDSADRRELRRITEMRFAQSFAPEAFGDYLREDRKGRLQVVRLPAENDPMLERIRQIRERDHLFVDTLQEHYGQFSADMHTPYQEWRKMSYEEAIALQELQAQSRRQLIAGGVSILAGILAQSSDNRSVRTAGSVGIIGGGYLLKGGLETRNEAQMHVQALEELGLSLEAEIAPRVIELEDRTVMLSGNVEEQYEQWRELLSDIYQAEMGLLDDPTAATGP